nr:unnamed protein product [Digitaria exilis]
MVKRLQSVVGTSAATVARPPRGRRAAQAALTRPRRGGAWRSSSSAFAAVASLLLAPRTPSWRSRAALRWRSAGARSRPHRAKTAEEDPHFNTPIPLACSALPTRAELTVRPWRAMPHSPRALEHPTELPTHSTRSLKPPENPLAHSPSFFFLATRKPTLTPPFPPTFPNTLPTPRLEFPISPKSGFPATLLRAIPELPRARQQLPQALLKLTDPSALLERLRARRRRSRRGRAATSSSPAPFPPTSPSPVRRGLPGATPARSQGPFFIFFLVQGPLRKNQGLLREKGVLPDGDYTLVPAEEEQVPEPDAGADVTNTGANPQPEQEGKPRSMT